MPLVITVLDRPSHVVPNFIIDIVTTAGNKYNRLTTYLAWLLWLDDLHYIAVRWMKLRPRGVIPNKNYTTNQIARPIRTQIK